MQGALKISEGSNLAIHALAYLAHDQEEGLASVARMAKVMGVSRDHLGKVMQRLTKQGMVRSRRGPRGGFELNVDPASLSLLQIVEIIDGPMRPPTCLLGSPVCVPGTCLLSGLAREVHDQVMEVLSCTMLSDLPGPR